MCAEPSERDGLSCDPVVRGRVEPWQAAFCANQVLGVCAQRRIDVTCGASRRADIGASAQGPTGFFAQPFPISYLSDRARAQDLQVSLAPSSRSRRHPYAHPAYYGMPRPRLVYATLRKADAWNNPFTATALHTLPSVLSHIRLTFWTL